MNHDRLFERGHTVSFQRLDCPAGYTKRLIVDTTPPAVP